MILAMVQGVKVTPITRTNVKVTWDALAVSDFNGDASTGGYIIEYRWVKNMEYSDWYFKIKLTEDAVVLYQLKVTTLVKEEP